MYSYALNSTEDQLCHQLAEHTQTSADDWFLVFKAREAMEVLFRSVAQQLGKGNVLTQLFTCCTAVNPIIAAELTPRYGECSHETLALDPQHMCLSSDDRAVVVQHSFGIVSNTNTEAIAQQAHEHEIPVLEDSCHCVGRLARNAAGEPIADFSVHSFGIQKMCATYFGGAIWVNPNSPFHTLCEEVKRQLSGLDLIDKKRARAARLYPAQIRLFNHLPAKLSHRLRSRMYAAGWFEPAVADDELCGKTVAVPSRPTPWIANQMLSALKSLPHIEAQHIRTIDGYREHLQHRDLVPRAAWSQPTQALLRLPVVFPSQELAQQAANALQAAGYFPDTWGRPELSPGVKDPLPYRIPTERSHLKVTTRLSEGILGLPADIGFERTHDVASIILATLTV